MSNHDHSGDSTGFGFVPTPDSLVDYMVSELMLNHRVTKDTRILIPGCGEGQFIKGLIRHLGRENLPHITAIELHKERCNEVEREFGGVVQIVNENFLKSDYAPFDLIIGNPPYVSIEGIIERDKDYFRKEFETAYNRFDLYFLFFEKSISLLKNNGKLVFVTPFKFLFVDSAKKLRKFFSNHHVQKLHIVSEDTFPGVVAYPCVSTIVNQKSNEKTTVIRQNGTQIMIKLTCDDGNWIRALEDKVDMPEYKRSLSDICNRISLGPATGKDKLFVVGNDIKLPKLLEGLSYPTIAGRELIPGTTVFQSSTKMIIPYHRDTNKPMTELAEKLEESFSKVNDELLHEKKKKNTKPWFKFKDSVPFQDLLSPKILIKDITDTPEFWLDFSGTTIPRHTVYYLTPKGETKLSELIDYLRSDIAVKWLESECQKASNGSLRVQTAVLRRLPVPDYL